MGKPTSAGLSLRSVEGMSEMQKPRCSGQPITCPSPGEETWFWDTAGLGLQGHKASEGQEDPLADVGMVGQGGGRAGGSGGDPVETQALRSPPSLPLA